MVLEHSVIFTIRRYKFVHENSVKNISEKQSQCNTDASIFFRYNQSLKP